MRKHQVITLLAVLIFYLYGGSMPAEAKPEPRIPKNKFVSLVFDDSGSMWNEKDQKGKSKPIDNWKYASYALQSFTALMDKQDQLKVVFMSSPKKAEPIELEEKLRQFSIDQIRAWGGKRNTPIESLHTSIGELAKAVDLYQNTDFWLVVLTDGIFNEIDYTDLRNSKEQIEKSKSNLFAKLKSLKEKMDGKGVTFHAALIPTETYLTPDEMKMMADFKRQWIESTSGMVLESNGQLDIIQRINEVAALMTNRDPGEKTLSDLNPVFEGNQLVLQSPFPLRKITILEQSVEDNQSFQMKEFYVNNKRIEQGIEGPYKVKTPDDPVRLNPPIRGSLTHLKNVNGDSIIEKGTYKIVFDRTLTDAQKNNIQVLAEPAVDFRIDFQKINDDGSLTGDHSLFFKGSKLRIETTLIKSETTDEEIDIRNVDVPKLFKVEAQIDGAAIPLAYDRKLNKFIGEFTIVKSEPIPIKVSVNVKGFYQKERETNLDVSPIRKMELRPNTDSWSASLDRLDKAAPFVITPMINGEEITADELKKIYKKLKIDSPEDIEITKKLDGNKIIISPQKLWPISRTTTGEIPLHITLPGLYAGEMAEGNFTLNIKDISFLEKYGAISIFFILSLLLIVYLIGIIIKPRFDNNRIWIEYKQNKGVRASDALPKILHFHGNGFFKRWLVPYVAEKKTIYDLTFKAHKKKDRIELVKECQQPDFFVQYRDLGDESRKKDILIRNNDLIKIKRGNYDINYVFKTR